MEYLHTSLKNSKSKNLVTTHSGKVDSVAVFSTEGALKQHVTDVVAGTVVEVSHVEQLGLKVLKVCLLPQSIQNFWLGQVWIGNLVVVVEKGQELTNMVEVIPGYLGEAELIEVTEGNGWEGEVGGCHFIQLGDVGVL